MLPRPAAAAVLSLAVLLARSSSAQAPPVRAQGAGQTAEQNRRIAGAVALHDEARVLYEKGEYRKAIEKLEAALELDPNGKELVYNLGLIHEKLLEIDVAERYYRRYLEMETEPKLVERAQTTLKRIEGAKKEVADREAAQRAHPEPAAAAPAPAPEMAASTRPLSPWFWVAGGVAASGVLIGSVLALTAVAGEPSSETRTGDGVTVEDLQEDADGAHTRAVVADVSFLVGGLAVGAAILLFAMRPPATSASSPSVALGPRAGAMRVRF